MVEYQRSELKIDYNNYKFDIKLLDETSEFSFETEYIELIFYNKILKHLFNEWFLEIDKLYLNLSKDIKQKLFKEKMNLLNKNPEFIYLIKFYKKVMEEDYKLVNEIRKIINSNEINLKEEYDMYGLIMFACKDYFEGKLSILLDNFDLNTTIENKIQLGRNSVEDIEESFNFIVNIFNQLNSDEFVLEKGKSIANILNEHNYVLKKV